MGNDEGTIYENTDPALQVTMKKECREMQVMLGKQSISIAVITVFRNKLLKQKKNVLNPEDMLC